MSLVEPTAKRKRADTANASPSTSQHDHREHDRIQQHVDVAAAQDAQDDKDDQDLFERLQKRKTESSRLSKIYAEFAQNATEEQLARFEHYKRSRLPRAGMRRLMQECVGSSSERCAIILASLAKAYAGELVECSREIMASLNEDEESPIQPHHLRMAHLRVQAADVVVPSNSVHRRRHFWRTDCGP